MGKLDIDVLILFIVVAIVVLALQRGSKREGMDTLIATGPAPSSSSSSSPPSSSSASSSSTSAPPAPPAPYDASDPAARCMALSTDNAETIALLKKKILDADTRSDRLEQNISLVQAQVDGLLQQQTQFAQDIAGNEPPSISGLDTPV